MADLISFSNESALGPLGECHCLHDVALKTHQQALHQRLSTNLP